MDSALQAQIRGFNKKGLSKQTTIDKSDPLLAAGVTTQPLTGSISQTSSAPKSKPGRVFSDSENDDDDDDDSAYKKKPSKHTDNDRSIFAEDDEEEEEEERERYHPPARPAPSAPAVTSDNDDDDHQIVSDPKKQKKKKEKSSKSKKSKSHGHTSNNNNTIEEKADHVSVNTRNLSRYSDFDLENDDMIHDPNNESMLGYLFILSIICSIDFSIPLPGLFPFINDMGKSTVFYGVAFSIYSFSQWFASICMGVYIKNRPIRGVLYVSIFFITLGNILYLCSSATFSSLVIFSRFFSGFGGGLLIVGYAHIARFSSKAQRAPRLTLYRMMECVAAVIGPSLGVLVSKCEWLFFSTVNAYNVCSFLNLLLIILYIILMLTERLFRKEEKWGIIRFFERSLEQENEDENQLSKLNESESFVFTGENVRYRQAGTILFIFVSMIISFWSFECAFIPLTVTQGEWSLWENYLLFFFIAVVITITFIIYRLVRSKFELSTAKQSEKLLLFSLLLMLGGEICLGNLSSIGNSNATANNKPSNFQLYIAAGILSVGFSLGTIPIPSLYERIMRMEIMHNTISWFFITLCLSRFLGPLLGALFYDFFGIQMVAHTSALLLLLALMFGFLFLSNATLSIDQPKKDIKVSNKTGGH